MLRHWHVTSNGTLIARRLYILLLWVKIARLLDLLQLGIVRVSNTLATISAISARLLDLLQLRIVRGYLATISAIPARLLDLLQLGIVRGSNTLATISAISARLLLLIAIYCRMRNGRVATFPCHLSSSRPAGRVDGAVGD